MTISEEMKALWSNFLNPDVLRRRFIIAGLFIVAHEKLIIAVKEPLFEFFSNSWSASDGWKEGPKYAEKVLSLDPKRKSDTLRSSISWLRQNEVINEDDEVTIKEATDARNVFAHELSAVLGGSKKSPDFEGLFPKLVELIVKIERWWIVNVEIAIDHDLAAQVSDPDGGYANVVDVSPRHATHCSRRRG